MSWVLKQKNDREDLSAELADFVAKVLEKAIAANNRASLAVAGGTTPRKFLEHLGNIPLKWRHVTVTLTDERCVSANSARSNARLIDETLMAGRACEANFVPLYEDTSDFHRHFDAFAERVRTHVMPIDICVLGMGCDMHTASLFPNAEGLQNALSPDCNLPIVRIHPLTGEEPRITMTANSLRQASQIHLLIFGKEKMDALEKARTIASVHEAPVNVVLEADHMSTVWYAP